MKHLFNPNTCPKRGLDEDAKHYAYRILRAGIMNLNLPPNYKLNTSELSNQLELSRTPIQDTIDRLSREYLVTSIPHKGAYVSGFHENIFEHSIWLQSIFGTQAIQTILFKNLSKGDLNPLKGQLKNLNNIIKKEYLDQVGLAIFNYYEQLYILSGNSDFVWEILKQYFADYERIVFYSTSTSLVVTQELYNDLVILTQHIDNKHPDQAYAAFNQHLSKVGELLNTIKQTQPDYLA